MATSATPAAPLAPRPTLTPGPAPASASAPVDLQVRELLPAERSPVYWTIVRFNGGIHATNSVTGRVFSGSTQVFNKLFK